MVTEASPHSNSDPSGRRTRMPIEQRAKQFMPFSALPGLDEALAAVEAEMELSNSDNITLRTIGSHR